MKKILSLAAVLLCLCLLMTACGDKGDDQGATPMFISEEAAIAAAEAHFNIKNGSVDEETGYPMAYRIFVSASEQSPTYRVGLQWYVESTENDGGEDELITGDGHWSTLDTVLVDAKTGEIIVEDEK